MKGRRGPRRVRVEVPPEDMARCAAFAERAVSRMAAFDDLDPRLRAIINEHGLAPVNAAWNLGLRGDRLVKGAEQFVRDIVGRPGA